MATSAKAAAPPAQAPGTEAEAAQPERQHPQAQAQSLVKPNAALPTAILPQVHDPHPRWPSKGEFILFFVLLGLLVASQLAGLVLLVIAIFSGPPFWAWALGFLAPLIFLLLWAAITGIGELFTNLTDNARERRAIRRAAKAQPQDGN